MYKNVQEMSWDELCANQAKSEPESEMYKKYGGEIQRRQVGASMRASEAAQRSAASARRASWAAIVAAVCALFTLFAKALGWF